MVKYVAVLLIVLITVSFLPSIGFVQPAHAFSSVVTVTANPLWTDTELSVEIGQKVAINASGSWDWGAGVVGPDGTIGTAGGSDYFLYDANHGELIAFVGSDPYQGHWGDGSFFPQHTGYWNVGSSGQFISNKTGELWLGCNDAAVTKISGDNSGTVTASITITSGPVEVSITPSNATTSIGGVATYEIGIQNYENISDTFAINIQGVDPLWCSLSQQNMSLAAYGVANVTLDLVPAEDPAYAGTYWFNVTVSGTWGQGMATANLVVTKAPLMYGLAPDDNSTVGSTNILFSWETSSNASSEVYIKQTGDLTFNHILDTAGENHYVYATNLTRNADYVWYAYSETAYGNVSSNMRALHVSNGVSFTQRNYTFNVQRDYAQNESISVVNTDVVPHDLLLEATNPYDDLIVGFVGPGSVDENVTLQPGETKPLDFEVFAQDAMQQSYTFTVNLTNLGPEQITDYALVNVNVRQPNLNLTLTEDSTDPVTLTKTITATNYGDPITDLSVSSSDGLVGEVSFEPTVYHDDLPTGGSLTFQVVPVLTTDFTGIEGNITATGAGQVIATLQVNFTLPPGKSVYSATIPQVSIEFDNYYDTDDSPNTNPLLGQPVESYLANGTLIFASQIIVDVFQNNTPASGANVSLTVWDSTGAVASLEYTVTDFTGKALFNVVGPAGNYSYQAELVDYGLKTETRSFSVSTSPLYEIRSNGITWLDVSDESSTYNLTENMGTVTLTEAPFTFRATTATTGENATFALVLRWDLDVFKDVYILGSIQNDTLTFQTDGIPAGNFTAIVFYYSPATGLSVSPAINVTNADSTSMYIQGNYTYYTPFPFNSTYFIRLVTERSVSSRDPAVAFDLVNIEPADATGSLYQLEYVIVSNETVQKDFQFCVNTTEGELYNTTFHLNLEPATPVEVNFTVPVELSNGTLQGEFDATLSTDSASVTTMTTPQLSYIYDSRIWVGSDKGIMDYVYMALFPPYGAWEAYQSASPEMKEVYTCGAFAITGSMGRIVGTASSFVGAVSDGWAFFTKADDIEKGIMVTEYGGAAFVLALGGGEAVGAAGSILLVGGLGQCVYDAYRVVAKGAEGSIGYCVCVLSKIGMWYCTNRPVVSAQVCIDPASVDVVQAAAVVKFSLPWPMDTYRHHNVRLYINGVEIGNLTNTIPQGYYIFPFNSSLLNYAANGPSENTITMKMDNLNGGHYVVTSDWEIILQLKQIALTVVASNQTEADSLVEQLSGAVACLPDFNVAPGLAFSTSQPREGQSITITANVLNLGTVGMSYVPVDLYVDSVKVESAIVSFLPTFANQTVDFDWIATRGTHNVTIVVNGAQLIPESDYSNNQAQTSITVLADDVAIANVTNAKNVVGQGFSFNVSVTAANDGDFTETFNVTAYVNATIIASENVNLLAGNSTTVTFAWNTTSFVYGNYTISAYAWPVPGEINMANNNMTGGTVYVGIPGDIAGDGRVDMGDIVSLCLAFGSTVGQSRCVPNCDIDGNGRVDMSDIIIALRNFGQHYP
ncbi:MAG: CARDB domain-containing protein [Candidatus Bathyarchaeia archaeon]